ncbi:hypothetical protein ILYODFUR_036804 [Ilyodon furcidens]|uniref:Uncharacterized protein n=1 Tax=Ilyodon furcidens TaxID=33524 RepID=A0ABV0VK60_9TELE
MNQVNTVNMFRDCMFRVYHRRMPKQTKPLTRPKVRRKKYYYHVEGRQKLGDKWEPQPYIVVKKQPDIPVYVVWPENSDTERVVHQNLLTQCMFLPVEQGEVATAGEIEADTAEEEIMEDTEDMTRQACGVMQGMEDLEPDELEENVEEIAGETTNKQVERPGVEGVHMPDRKSEGRTEHVTDGGITSAPGPSALRRNLPRNWHPPRRFSCES